MLREVRNLHTGTSLYFSARTSYEAMTMLIYYLNTKGNADDLTINKTDSNLFLYLDYNGETYATKME